MSGFRQVIGTETQVNGGAVGEATATCPAGQYAVGGGAVFDGAPVDGDHLLGNGAGVATGTGGFAAAADGQKADAWHVEAYNAATSTRTLVASVVCLKESTIP